MLALSFFATVRVAEHLGRRGIPDAGRELPDLRRTAERRRHQKVTPPSRS
jgi:hypothetical protein